MFIYAAHIKHFRLFKDVWFFPHAKINCILGPNNSGKSTLLEALGIILDPKSQSYRDDFITQFDFYNRETIKPIQIDVWLHRHDIESDDIVSKAFDKLSKWQLVKAVDGHPLRLIPIISDPLQEIESPIAIELLRIHFDANWDDQTRTAEHGIKILDEADNAVELFSLGLRKLLHFNLISANREPLRDVSLSKRSIFAQFLDDDKVNPVFRELLTIIEKEKDSILDTGGIKEVIDRLKCIVASQVIGNLTGEHEDAVSITFLNSEINKFRAESCFSVKVGSKTDEINGQTESIHVPLEYQGDGIQNIFLLVSLTEIIRIRSGTSHCIVVIEEPEQHLEPSQVKWVFSEICRCFESNSNIEKKSDAMSGSQIFVTSHSPALAGEINGADSLVLMPVKYSSGDDEVSIFSASYLARDVKKSFERYRDLFSPALLARYILLVEGSSEIGFLPVAFRHLSINSWENPFHLGLEILNGNSKTEALNYARRLSHFNRPLHVLLDYDTKDKSVTEIMNDPENNNFHISCWADNNVLSFTEGADLETVLVKEIHPDILIGAIKDAYTDPGHELVDINWKTSCDELITDPAIKEELYMLGPKSVADISFDKVCTDDNVRRAYLFILLHTPHACKSTNEMRIIAEYLATRDSIPASVNILHKRIISWITDDKKELRTKYLVTSQHEYRS